MTREERQMKQLAFQRNRTVKSDDAERSKYLESYVIQNQIQYLYDYFPLERPMNPNESEKYLNDYIKSIRFTQICMTCTFLVFMFMPFMFYLVGASTHEVMEYLTCTLSMFTLPLIIAEILVLRHINRVDKYYKTNNRACLVTDAYVFNFTMASSGSGRIKRLCFLIKPDQKILSTKYYMMSDYLYKQCKEQPFQKAIAIYNPFRKEYDVYSPAEFNQ